MDTVVEAVLLTEVVAVRSEVRLGVVVCVTECEADSVKVLVRVNVREAVIDTLELPVTVSVNASVVVTVLDARTVSVRVSVALLLDVSELDNDSRSVTVCVSVPVIDSESEKESDHVKVPVDSLEFDKTLRVIDSLTVTSPVALEVGDNDPMDVVLLLVSFGLLLTDDREAVWVLVGVKVTARPKLKDKSNSSKARLLVIRGIYFYFYPSAA